MQPRSPGPREEPIGRHQRIRPYTPGHNGKVERYQQTPEEFRYARLYESEQQRRDAIADWKHRSTYHRHHIASGDQPPVSRLHTGVDNVIAHYN